MAHVLVQRRFRRITLEHLAIAAAKARAARLVERKLARGQQPHVGHRVERALRIDIERADAFDVVAEEVEPEGQGASHREQVDQSATDAELARRHDLRDVLVAGERELRAQSRDIEMLALLQEKSERREIRRRREAVEGGRGGDHEHVAFAARNAIERGKTLRHEVVVRRKRIVRQRLPVGQQRDAQARREPRDLVGEALRRESVGADDGQHPLLPDTLHRELRQRDRVGRAGQCGPAQLLAGRRQIRDERGQRSEHPDGRCEVGRRGRGGGDACCRGRLRERRSRCRRPGGGGGLWHEQLRIERGLYVGAIIAA